MLICELMNAYGRAFQVQCLSLSETKRVETSELFVRLGKLGGYAKAPTMVSPAKISRQVRLRSHDEGRRFPGFAVRRKGLGVSVDSIWHSHFSIYRY